MITLVALTVGLIAWVVLWGLGAKGFDAFLVTVLLTFSAYAVESVLPAVRKLMRGDPERPS